MYAFLLWLSVVVAATRGLNQLQLNTTVELVEKGFVRTVQAMLCQFLRGDG